LAYGALSSVSLRAFPLFEQGIRKYDCFHIYFSIDNSEVRGSSDKSEDFDLGWESDLEWQPVLPRERLDPIVLQPNIDEAIARMRDERLQEPWLALLNDFDDFEDYVERQSGRPRIPQ
jgi:hypothetical protein